MVPIWFIRNMAGLAYGLSVLLLLAVEFFGEVGMGAQRWIDIGPLRLQPSELMKITQGVAHVIPTIKTEDAMLFQK
jgi:rod shape determining protein RodA